MTNDELKAGELMVRKAEKTRKTKETSIELKLVLDGKGQSKVSSGIPFLDHMVELMTKQSGFDVVIDAKGDLEVDTHHTVEDIGLVLGEALSEALGAKENIERYASAMVPMDEALVMIAVDIGGRPFLDYDVDLPREEIKGFNVDLVNDFLQAFVSKAGVNLHLRLLSGRNSHHIIEAIFKGLGLVLRKATAQTRDQGVPSTKGVL